MRWTVPDPEAVDEPFTGSERSILDGFLEAQRHQFLRRCAGLDGAELVRAAAEPSVLTLLGLIRHLTNVERHWVRNRFGGADLAMVYSDPFASVEPADAESVHRLLGEEWVAVRTALTGLSLDTVYDHPRHGPMTLRWLYTHLIREYAGHIGHADLLRECIDGTTFS